MTGSSGMSFFAFELLALVYQPALVLSVLLNEQSIGSHTLSNHTALGAGVNVLDRKIEDPCSSPCRGCDSRPFPF